MRLLNPVCAALTFAGSLTLAGGLALAAAGPAVAAGPVIDVTPSIAAPGTSVTFAVTCGPDATSATLFGTTIGLAEQIPMQGSTLAGEFVTIVSLPTSIIPGTYTPSIDCSNGVSGLATLTVNAVAGTPTGAPVTGDGATSTTVDGLLAAAGVGLLGLGVVTGAVAGVRQRLRGTRRGR
jgi:hypothetical protein